MKRRHQFEKLTQLRLSLYFFDEQVQVASQTLYYLDQHQGTNEDYQDDFNYFDFGRNRESIKRQREYITRQRCYSNNLGGSIESSSGSLRKFGSFIFKEYHVPDKSEIWKAIEDNNPFNYQQSPAFDDDGLPIMEISFNNNNQYYFKTFGELMEEKYQKQTTNQQLTYQKSNNNQDQMKNLLLPLCNYSFQDQQENHNNENPFLHQHPVQNQQLLEIPSNNQYIYSPSLNSVFTNTSRSQYSDYEESEFALEALNNLTQDRVNIAEKKLNKGKESRSRKVSAIEEDLNNLNFKNAAQRRQSVLVKVNPSFVRSDSKDQSATTNTQQSPNQAKKQKSGFKLRARDLGFDPEKIKARLQKASWINKDDEHLAWRKECLNYLRKMGKKMRGQNTSNTILEVDEENPVQISYIQQQHDQVGKQSEFSSDNTELLQTERTQKTSSQNQRNENGTFYPYPFKINQDQSSHAENNYCNEFQQINSIRKEIQLQEPNSSYMRKTPKLIEDEQIKSCLKKETKHHNFNLPHNNQSFAQIPDEIIEEKPMSQIKLGKLSKFKSLHIPSLNTQHSASIFVHSAFSKFKTYGNNYNSTQTQGQSQESEESKETDNSFFVRPRLESKSFKSKSLKKNYFKDLMESMKELDSYVDEKNKSLMENNTTQEEEQYLIMRKKRFNHKSSTQFGNLSNIFSSRQVEDTSSSNQHSSKTYTNFNNLKCSDDINKDLDEMSKLMQKRGPQITKGNQTNLNRSFDKKQKLSSLQCAYSKTKTVSSLKKGQKKKSTFCNNSLIDSIEEIQDNSGSVKTNQRISFGQLNTFSIALINSAIDDSKKQL